MDSRKESRFLVVSLATAFCALLSVAAFNILVDRNNIFSSGNSYAELAQNLAGGKFLAGCQNCDIRLLKENLARFAEIPDAIAVGSSSLMELDGAIAGKEKFLNLWVSGGNQEDILAILGIYRHEKGGLPGAVLLGVEPHYFEKTEGFDGWKIWKFHAHQMKMEIGGGSRSFWGEAQLFWDKMPLYKLAQMINPEITADNFAFLLNGGPKYAFEILDIQEQQEEGALYRPDGSLLPSRFAESLNPMPALFNFGNGKRRIDPGRLALFREIVDYLRARAIQVTFYLPPWHPAYYKKLTKEMGETFFVDVEKAVRSYAKEKDIPVVGSYDPAKAGWQGDAFRDAHHSRQKFMAELFGAGRQGLFLTEKGE